MITIAGPCSIESREQFLKTCEFLSGIGISYVRGGLKKYRSDPKAFQGHGETALAWVMEAKKKYGIKFVGEVFSFDDLVYFWEYIDVIQIGSRNMYNSQLLKDVNSFCEAEKKPVLFKRHFASSLIDFVRHAEYLKNCEVWMCLRGAMSLFPVEQRFFPDMSDIPRLRKLTENKIIWDPSHAGCQREYVPNLARAGMIFGADGLAIEFHHNPDKALSDPDQQLDFKQFKELILNIREKYEARD